LAVCHRVGEEREGLAPRETDYLSPNSLKDERDLFVVIIGIIAVNDWLFSEEQFSWSHPNH
jgi:hypothetical protein